MGKMLQNRMIIRLDNMIMRPLCDRVILVLILVLKVPRGASVPRLLEKITQNGQKQQISDEKRPEILRFQVFLVEISGIEPLTS